MGCDSASSFGEGALLQQQCCPCANQGPAMLAIKSADKHSVTNGVSPESPRMSLLEVMHTSAYKQQEGHEPSSNECCPCGECFFLLSNESWFDLGRRIPYLFKIQVFFIVHISKPLNIIQILLTVDYTLIPHCIF